MTPVLRMWGMIRLNSWHVFKDIDGKDTDLRTKGTTFYHFTSFVVQKLQPGELHLS